MQCAVFTPQTFRACSFATRRAFPPTPSFPHTMVMVSVSCHPKGLHPLQAAKAWHMVREEGMPLRDVCQEVVNMQGENPGLKGVWDAVKRIDQQHAMAMLDSIPSGNYKNCGRKRKLTRDQEKAVGAFVKRWSPP